MSLKAAELDMGQAGCPSCAYTVEHLGRKIPGVREVRVDLATHRIRVRYEGVEDVPERIRQILVRIGHDAVVTAIHDVPENDGGEQGRGP